MKNCIVIQVHIPSLDPQGNLTFEQKQKLIDLSIKHLRKNNPNIYIAFTGHGIKPFKSTLDLCDYVYWEDQLRPIYPNGYVIGMPAQFFFVSKGIKHCKEKGFNYCLKVRGDGIYGISNIIEFCSEILQKEQKRLLLTQMTGSLYYKMGDCFMYSDIDLLDKVWDLNNTVKDADGLINTGIHFVEYFTNQKVPKFQKDLILYQNMTWEQLLKKYCSFRDVYTLNYMDLRWNYHQLEKLNWDKICTNILNGNFNYKDYLWGKTNKWHIFDNSGNLIYNYEPFYYSEKTFYGDGNVRK